MLNELKKSELIDIIQDYQEMVSEIENAINPCFAPDRLKDYKLSRNKNFLAVWLARKLRKIMSKYLEGK